jgi:hypothetical protein
MLKKFKFKPLDLAIALVLVSPIFITAYISFHPWETKAIAADEATKGTVNSLARAAEAYFKTYGAYPESPSVLLSSSILAALPADISRYSFKISEDGQRIVIYSEAVSLVQKEYCHQNVTFIIYSSEEQRTNLVCDTPLPGRQHFVN